MNIDNKKSKKNRIQFVETVLSIEEGKLHANDSPHNKKDIWILKCSEKEIILLPELLEDKVFFEMIKGNEVAGKKFAFTILKKGRYLIDAKQI